MSEEAIGSTSYIAKIIAITQATQLILRNVINHTLRAKEDANTPAASNLLTSLNPGKSAEAKHWQCR